MTTGEAKPSALHPEVQEQFIDDGGMKRSKRVRRTVEHVVGPMADELIKAADALPYMERFELSAAVARALLGSPGHPGVRDLLLDFYIERVVDIANETENDIGKTMVLCMLANKLKLSHPDVFDRVRAIVQMDKGTRGEYICPSAVVNDLRRAKERKRRAVANKRVRRSTKKARGGK